MALPEVWMRGPLQDVPPLLQPVGHSLLQAQEEVRRVIPSLTREQLWARPAGAAAVGYHIQHAAGSIDRLFTYARGEQLSEAQRDDLTAENATEIGPRDATWLVNLFDHAIEVALRQVRATPERSLTAPRGVGRAQLPSTVLGLMFHAAEHTQRHVGQAITTAKIVR